MEWKLEGMINTLPRGKYIDSGTRPSFLPEDVEISLLSTLGGERYEGISSCNLSINPLKKHRISKIVEVYQTKNLRI